MRGRIWDLGFGVRNRDCTTPSTTRKDMRRLMIARSMIGACILPGKAHTDLKINLVTYYPGIRPQ